MKLSHLHAVPLALPLAAWIGAAGVADSPAPRSAAPEARASGIGAPGITGGIAATDPGIPAELLRSLAGKRAFAQEDVATVVATLHRAGVDQFTFAVDPDSGEFRLSVGDTVTPHLDIKPGSCPNPIQVGCPPGALARVATGILGNAFDVTQVNLGSVRMSPQLFIDLVLTPEIAPIHMNLVDVGTPFDGPDCACNSLHGDGNLDLAVFFDESEVVNVFKLYELPDGFDVPLRVTGLLLDNSTIFSAPQNPKTPW